MNVMKFGGTSLGSPEAIIRCAELVEREIKRSGQNPIVVVSAHSKVTDLLLNAAELAVRGAWEDVYPKIVARHEEMLDGLGLPRSIAEKNMKELRELLRGIHMVREVTPRLKDFVASFGERLSSKCFAALLRKRGHETAEAINAYDFGLQTDSHFMNARPLPESYERIAAEYQKHVGKLLVVTGFIAKDKRGEITTIGRSGSDFSAAIFGAAVGAGEIQVWKDVPGVLTADPTIVPDAKPLSRLSFSEAAELAYYGAEVLHPATLVPAIQRKIPVRVLHTFDPNAPGTTIYAEAALDQATPVKTIVYKENQTLINVRSERMLGAEGFMSRMFHIFEKHRIVIDMIATSEVSVSMTTGEADSSRLKAVRTELENIAKVDVQPNKTIVAVVGEGMKNIVGLAARVFRAVADAGVNLQMISQGASEINITFLVNDEDIPPTVRALHQEFFGEKS